MKTGIKPIFIWLMVCALTLILPGAAFAPNIGERLNSLEKFQNLLLVLFCISGVILCYVNIKLATGTCTDISLKAGCGVHGFFYILIAVLSFFATPEYLSRDGFIINHINFYFPAANWLLLFFWLIIRSLPQQAAGLCQKTSRLPVPWLGLVAYIILVLPPTVFAPFYLVSLFL